MTTSVDTGADFQAFLDEHMRIAMEAASEATALQLVWGESANARFFELWKSGPHTLAAVDEIGEQVNAEFAKTAGPGPAGFLGSTREQRAAIADTGS